MHNYEQYFDNIVSRSWLGTRNNTDIKLEKSSIEEIYFELMSIDKIILIGKTEKFYFILECHESNGYQYSNGLFNDNMHALLAGYSGRELMLNGNTIEQFVASVLLKTKLDKILPHQNTSTTKRTKL